MEELSEGRRAVDADVRLTRHVVEHDVALVVGPVLPHGGGTWDDVHCERCRVDVTLVTAIPRAKVLAANLGYIAPEDFDLAAYEADPDTFVVPKAGEVLFRLR